MVFNENKLLGHVELGGAVCGTTVPTHRLWKSDNDWEAWSACAIWHETCMCMCGGGHIQHYGED